MASHPPFFNPHRIAELKAKLDERLVERRQGIRSNPSRFTLLFDKIFAHPETATKKNATLTWFGQFTLEDKEIAINKLKADLSDTSVGKVNPVIYSDKDLEALRDGDTGKVLAQYEDILPACFRVAENIMINARDARIEQAAFRTRK